MSKKTLARLLGIILAVVVLPSSGAMGEDREFIGYSDAAMPADAGIFDMHAACGATYAGGRMCTSRDIMDNGASTSAVITAELGWTNPSIVAISNFTTPTPNGTTSFLVGLSGMGAHGIADMTCFNWTFDQDTATGLVFGNTFAFPHFDRVSCDETDIKVACCCPLGTNCTRRPRLVLPGNTLPPG